jgi:5'-3' exoribonuclease 2
MVYIAIDGVAPMAKIVQQQQRRFKSAYEAETVKRIAVEEGFNEEKIHWDSNAITPGTKFMDRLLDHLDGHIQFINHMCPDIEFILDGSDNPGEGEHKLFHHMDKHLDEHKSFQKVVYGLDADLIVLSILRGYDRMYLYREASYFPFQIDGEWEYLYMDVGVLREAILEQYWIGNLMDTRQRCIIDYVFLTFLLGNDFIPNLFILKIQKGGFESLNKLYCKGFQRYSSHLISKDFKIHTEFFKFILEGLYKGQDEKLVELRNDFSRFNPRLNPKLTQYQRRVEMFHFYPKMADETDNIQIGDSGWEDRFYEYWLDGTPDKFMIDGMIANYMEGLHWILRYYCNGHVDWHWFYRFPIAPCLKDLVGHIRGLKVRYLTHEFLTEPINRNYNLLQLAIVLPKSSIKCVPKRYRHIVNHSNMWYLYPKDFCIKTLYKKYYHECIAVLPQISNCSMVLDTISNLQDRLADIVIHS